MLELTLQRRAADEQPAEHRVQVGDLSITYFDWPGEGRPIVLAHATGFHARTWDSLARLLGGRRVVAIDLRGHGRSDNFEPPTPLDAFGDDVAAVVRDLDIRDAIGVGHSMGGHSVTVAASLDPSRFGALLLLDPVMHTAPDPGVPNPAERPAGTFHFVAKRRNEWGGPEEMVERFSDRFPYSIWAPGILDDYARYGLLPNPDGEGYVLACPPAIEAAIYGVGPVGSRDLLAQVLPKVTIPVRVIRGRQRQPGEEVAPFATSPTRPDLASLFLNGEDLLMGEMSHFIPMEDPEMVARQILEIDSRLG